MPTQVEKAELFASLHVKGNPLLLFNIWDAGSAKAVASAGAKALATGSASVAEANGYEDGETTPLDFVLDNIRRIVSAVDVPVSLDFEGGYAVEPEALIKNVAKVVQTGVVGINFEDQVVNGEGLHPLDLQVARIQTARRAADEAGVPLYINARTDIYLQTPPAERTQVHLAQAIERAQAFAEAGASGFFAPGLKDPDDIAKLCAASPLPVNIMNLMDDTDNAKLAQLGVARISYGPSPYRTLMGLLTGMAKSAFGEK
ncbi:MAG: isocitrate lyase/phosphoenolpyruvate mutase family protein [Anaerolineaceae bacterium]|nr:isocitrate lyase/phosphoenolpyruvate mutase family protein [Anaerolineaceae bacterium]